MINIGSLGITDMRIGTSEVLSGYVGTALIYPVAPPQPSYVDCGCIYGKGNVNEFITFGAGYISTTLKYRFVGQFLSQVGSTHLGTYNLPDSNDYRLFMQQVGGYTFLDMGNKRCYANNQQTPWSAGTDVDITVYNFGIIDNSTGNIIISDTSAGSVPDTASFHINIGRMQVKSLKMWNTAGGTDVLIFDGVPKIRTSDNAAGLYDNVSGNFFTNSQATIYTCY